MILPKSDLENLKEVLKDQRPLNLWVQPLTEIWIYPEGDDEVELVENSIMIKVLLREENTEKLLDTLEQKFSQSKGFRINLISLAASVPLPQALEAPQAKSAEKEAENERISRQELYNNIENSAKVSKMYLALIVFSSIVAAIGLLGNSPIVIIGAMVIAPLLGPIMALSLAITIADRPLARNALKAGLIGLALAVGISAVLGYFFSADPTNSEIASRLKVNLVDIALALASGGAGALALTSGVSGTLIGVAISASLVPPLVIFGLMLGSGNITLALGTLMLFLVNVICINLAGTAIFISQGIKPSTWWEAKRARKETTIAILIWLILLIILALIIQISQGEINLDVLSRLQ
ncbi:MAG TPA: TIGR00341 family protein, partial [Methanotrichaceae archaeon]|nr:TIGR00341 family protein [Methanotrichaceae archaeon]